ncbi:MAG: conjugal transfer protein TraB, partial [Novosphingobium sp.]
QKMTCPQPGGRYAVSEVKGFIAFGGKTGVRGRVVSREGSLAMQAFLAGLVSGGGNALNSAFNQPLATITDKGEGG